MLPLLYLHGLSSSDFAPALGQFCGSTAGLAPSTITRLTAQWRDDAAAFNQRSLAETDYVYIWVDGIHLKVRLEQDKVSLLVMIGVRADGRKELIALVDVFRESSEVLGRSAARLQTTRHDRAGARRRRRCARVLEGGTRGVPRSSALSWCSHSAIITVTMDGRVVAADLHPSRIRPNPAGVKVGNCSRQPQHPQLNLAQSLQVSGLAALGARELVALLLLVFDVGR